MQAIGNIHIANRGKSEAAEISKEIGISDSMITRFCKKNNIPKPPRGYWAKKAAGK